MSRRSLERAARPARDLRVGIVGCGSAGPALALFLARAGHHPVLLERAPSLGPVGTGFLLQPTGLAVLDALGLRDEAVRFGAPVRKLHAQTRRGRVLLDLEYEELGPGIHGLGMQRATLLDILIRALAQEQVRVHCGADVQVWRDDSEGRWLETADQRYGPFDLVVIANGARSEARGWPGLRHRVRAYEWGALWTLVPDPEQRLPDCLSQVVDGSRAMLGTLPSGMRSDQVDAERMVSVFWSVRGSDLDDVQQAGPEALRAAIRRLSPDALLPPDDSMARWGFAEYVDCVMPRWHAPGWVVLGDAAHAMSPQLGQGVNLALWDAWTLASCLASGAALSDALADYSRLRRHPLAFYQRATRWLTPFFQSAIPGAALARDALLPSMNRIAPLRAQMLRTMAGLKRGVLRASYPVRPRSPL